MILTPLQRERAAEPGIHRYVLTIAESFARSYPGLDGGDIRGEALLGLCLAAARWDGRGQWPKYCGWFVKYRLIRHCRLASLPHGYRYSGEARVRGPAPRIPTVRSLCVGEQFPDPRPGPAEAAASCDSFEYLTAGLTPRQAEVAEAEFEGGEVYVSGRLNFTAVGNRLGVSRQRVWQLRREAMAKVYEAARAAGEGR